MNNIKPLIFSLYAQGRKKHLFPEPGEHEQKKHLFPEPGEHEQKKHLFPGPGE
ncbi:MAG: hypothetical protein VZQ80_11445 [Lachnospiraceae bacterium]|nr:hypothetical protein [Lachnospiraceae bacterium]